MIQEELLAQPRDLDLRFYMPNATYEVRERLKSVQVEIFLELAQEFSIANNLNLAIPTAAEAIQGMFTAFKNVGEGKEQFLIVSFSDRNPTDERRVDLSFVHSLAREYLFDRDGLGIPIQQFFLHSSCRNSRRCNIHPVGKILQGMPFFLDRFTRKIGIHDIKTINHQGWSVLQTLCTKGYRHFVRFQQRKLLEKTIERIPSGKVPAYADKGIYFADAWISSLRSHGKDCLYEGVAMLFQYYEQLEEFLTDKELASFERLALEHLKGIQAEEQPSVPLLSELCQGLLSGDFSIRESLEALQMGWFMAMGAPTACGSATAAIHFAVSNRCVEITARDPQSSKLYAVRFPLRLEKAFSYFASGKFKSLSAITLVRNALLQGREIDFKRGSRLKPQWESLGANPFTLQARAEQLLASKDRECRKLGFELLLNLAELQNTLALRTALIRNIPEGLNCFDPDERHIILERVERLFVKGQGLSHASLFSAQGRQEIIEGSDLHSVNFVG